jgi:hypothetical protein
MNDDTYTTASLRALGRNIAEMFLGLIEGGMSRREALAVISEYVRALATQKPEPKP